MHSHFFYSCVWGSHSVVLAVPKNNHYVSTSLEFCAQEVCDGEQKGSGPQPGWPGHLHCREHEGGPPGGTQRLHNMQRDQRPVQRPDPLPDCHTPIDSLHNSESEALQEL